MFQIHHALRLNAQKKARGFPRLNSANDCRRGSRHLALQQASNLRSAPLRDKREYLSDIAVNRRCSVSLMVSIGFMSPENVQLPNSLSDSVEAQRFARAIGPVWKSLDRIADHEQRIRARMAEEQRARMDPLPPGAGVGPTPPDTPPEGLSPLQRVQVTHMDPQAIHRTLTTLHAQYAVSERDAMHLGWLMQNGLIREEDALAVVVSLDLERRQRVLSQEEIPVVMQDAQQCVPVTASTEMRDSAMSTNPAGIPLAMPILQLPALAPMPKTSNSTELQLPPTLLPARQRQEATTNAAHARDSRSTSPGTATR